MEDGWEKNLRFKVCTSGRVKEMVKKEKKERYVDLSCSTSANRERRTARLGYIRCELLYSISHLLDAMMVVVCSLPLNVPFSVCY